MTKLHKYRGRFSCSIVRAKPANFSDSNSVDKILWSFQLIFEEFLDECSFGIFIVTLESDPMDNKIMLVFKYIFGERSFPRWIIRRILNCSLEQIHVDGVAHRIGSGVLEWVKPILKSFQAAIRLSFVLKSSLSRLAPGLNNSSKLVLNGAELNISLGINHGLLFTKSFSKTFFKLFHVVFSLIPEIPK